MGDVVAGGEGESFTKPSPRLAADTRAGVAGRVGRTREDVRRGLCEEGANSIGISSTSSHSSSSFAPRTTKVHLDQKIRALSAIPKDAARMFKYGTISPPPLGPGRGSAEGFLQSTASVSATISRKESILPHKMTTTTTNQDSAHRMLPNAWPGGWRRDKPAPPNPRVPRV